MVLKESGKAHFKTLMSWTMAVEVGGVALADFTLRAYFGLILREWEMSVLRAGRGCS